MILDNVHNVPCRFPDKFMCGYHNVSISVLFISYLLRVFMLVVILALEV